MKPMEPPPFSRSYDLATLPPGGAEIKLSAKENERASLAHWLGVGSVEALDAVVSLRRQSTHAYGYEARFEARLTQNCVVTLVPLPTRVEGRAERLYMLPARHPPKRGSEQATEIAAETGAETEILSDPLIDLAAPVLEELSLGIDPYPRAPGAVFAAGPAGEAQGESPFAALRALKDEPGGQKRAKERK